MDTFDLMFSKNPAKSLAAERDRADAATRRCQELRAELATARHAIKSLRTELETLRACLAAGK